jgi:hypothetical protein
MTTLRNALAAAIVAATTMFASALAGEKETHGTAYEPMAPFEKLAGRVWKGEGTGPNGEAIVDIAVHELILGGRAFQSTHKLEGASYGGRTIFFYDEGAKEYVFHYFTTAGFHTTGTIEPTETGFIAVEAVKGHDKYAEVRSEMIVESAVLRVVSSHVDHDGKESSGDALIYAEMDRKDVILLFDEADALLGRRTEVKDSHDRYANLETSYLLSALGNKLFLAAPASNKKDKADDDD